MSHTGDGKNGWWNRTIQPRASGIFRRRTAFLSKSQVVRRPPRLYRPPLVATLSVLLAAVVLAAIALAHRRQLDRRFAAVVVDAPAEPFEIQRIRRDLAALELDEKSLERELDARLAAVESQESEDFYLVLDRAARKLTLRLGDRIVREAALEYREPRQILSASNDRLPPAPLSGAFTVREKLERPVWKAPSSAWAAAGRRTPSAGGEIAGGLGRYVIVLTEEVVIHSPPPPESPLRGPKPGSFLVPEADLAAIWKRIGPETRVYVF
jgi:hypothetical protein